MVGQALINAVHNTALSVMKRLASAAATASSWRLIVVWWRGHVASSHGEGGYSRDEVAECGPNNLSGQHCFVFALLAIMTIVEV